MKSMKLTALLLAAVTAISMTAVAVPAATDQVEAIKKAGKIQMTTNAEFEPFEYKDGDEIVGIDIDLSQAIADKLGVKLEVSDIAFDSLIPSMNAGKADFIAAGMTATEDRKKNVDFSDPYFNASQAIIVAKDSDIKTREDLNGKTVGVQQGTTGDTYCTNDDGSSDVKVKEVKRYPKGMDAVSDLIAGRLDAVVIDDYPAEKLAAKNADKVVKLDDALTEEEYAIAMPKGSDLVDVVNGVIKDLKDSGELNKIIDKYIGDDTESGASSAVETAESAAE
ncbi:MAG: basic amino acid ABC transporter substrate-binding protein [Clostridiales bacterium]|jgi:polar amino acid transport system substrate-binding protein|uniref:basic amino acid ABC transporter substrate-binding protein n=1 Tax=Chordicoccus furentiruminis TaxID=2709410 RepID=UPI0023A87C4B|nr:basic amino acid ABC transporter substrate-binding protein [Chordicoccus furentiruminis]MCI6172690.1 basic amino acid ABC transporter substrate-binding protein [Clostridiales bacterium]